MGAPNARMGRTQKSRNLSTWKEAGEKCHSKEDAAIDEFWLRNLKKKGPKPCEMTAYSHALGLLHSTPAKINSSLTTVLVIQKRNSPQLGFSAKWALLAGWRLLPPVLSPPARFFR